jgi:DNA mismatch repair protein MutL
MVVTRGGARGPESPPASNSGAEFTSAPRKVRRLPDDLVNKIAAGEVVERPASVVKELVENALDAGARGVQVETEGGGKALVRVRDDGEGMSRADAEQALERHATSKLRALDDLQAIGTHGFRGEALPSIASVSHLVLRTRDQAGPAGTEVEVRDGRRVQVKDVGHPRGTTVEVRDLFGSVPARRKFLRAEATEASHVAEALTLLALARPEVGFTLTSGARTVIQAPPAEDLRARLYQVFGGARLAEMVPVDGGSDWARVRGFVSRPEASGSARPSLRLFVNGRAVRDRALAKAVADAYRTASAGQRGYEAFLFLEAPLHLVDVNVHPAKAEVRFADGRTPYAAVERAVREALSAGSRALAPRAATAGVEAAVAASLARGAPGSYAIPFGAGLAAEGAAPALLAPGAPPPAPAPPLAEVLRPLLDAGAPAVLGQHRATDIVASDGEELLLVDQHTAHERVRFEALLAGLERRAVESQLLLAPPVFELAPRLRPVLEAHAEGLAALGYDVEPFGGGQYRLCAVPAVLPAADPPRALEAVLSDLVERDAGEWAVDGARERLAATLACHSAVRAGQPLAAAAMSAIVRELLATRHPTLCPHGRPTLVRIPRADLTRWFGRTGWRRQ